jgi:hypothetical protein
MTEKSFYPCKNKDCVNYDQFIMPEKPYDPMGYFVQAAILYCLCCTRFEGDDFYQPNKSFIAPLKHPGESTQ